MAARAQFEMMTVPIPLWNAEGLLPAADVVDPTSGNRAPYPVSLIDVVMRFSTSKERAKILAGFLGYRAALHGAGLTVGFQWLDGSFMEHIEIGHRQRPPDDIDVVTFYRMPVGMTQMSLVAGSPGLFPETEAESDALKARYSVDAFAFSLGMSGERLVDHGAYWYGVWAHQRDTFKWKGFLQIDLAPSEDAAAHALLTPPPIGTP